MANDKRILGERRNSALGNVIALSVSLACVSLGLWYAFLMFSGQTTG